MKVAQDTVVPGEVGSWRSGLGELSGELPQESDAPEQDEQAPPEASKKEEQYYVLHELITAPMRKGVLTEAEGAGVDALQILKSLEKDIPIILVASTLGEESAVEWVKKEASDYVLKDQLVRLPVAVGRALEEKSLRETFKIAEEAVREAEERYALVARGANDGLWDWNLKTNVVCFSSR